MLGSAHETTRCTLRLGFFVALTVGLLASQLLPARRSGAADPSTAQANATPEVSLVAFEGVVSQEGDGSIDLGGRLL